MDASIALVLMWDGVGPGIRFGDPERDVQVADCRTRGRKRLLQVLGSVPNFATGSKPKIADVHGHCTAFIPARRTRRSPARQIAAR